MLPSIEEIIEETNAEIDRVYSDYLERLEMSRLATEKFFDFLRNLLITFTANAANTTIVYLCIDFGMSWLSACIFGFGFGLIPAAYHLNNAGIDLSSEYKVKNISSLLLATGCVVAAFSVSYQSGGEKRTLVDYTNKGLQESSKEVSNYEVKVSPWSGINLWFSYHGLESAGNLAIASLVVTAAIKLLFSKKR